MTTSRRAHNTDFIGVKTSLCRLAAHLADSTLQILPSGGMLRQATLLRWAWCAVLECHNGDTQLIQVATYGSNLKTVGVVAHIAAARVDNLYRIGLFVLWQVPLDVWLALVSLRRRHLALCPQILNDMLCAGIVIREASHKLLLRLKLTHIAHLTHKLHRALKAECAVTLIWVEVQLGRNLHLAQTAVDEC